MIAVAALQRQHRARALGLARSLAVPFLELDAGTWRAHAAHPLLLLLDDDGLWLASAGNGRTQPVRVDFCDPALLRRVREKGARRQDLARAVGVDRRRGLSVLDATAGWGRDGALLAALGCSVTMVERNAIIAALLADGLRRALDAPRAEVREWAGRMQLVAADATEMFRTAPALPPDVVLLDPMFPERTGQAAARKEMRWFQEVVGDDADAPALLAAALSVARYRVVVKRPRRAPPLGGKEPGFALEGRSTRFDIYPLRSLR